MPPKIIYLNSPNSIPPHFTGVVLFSDVKWWVLNRKRHRTDGPAVEWADGTKQWYLNGLRHRVDGPAVEYTNGSKEWWVNGKCYTEKGWKVAVEKLKKEIKEKVMEESTKEETVSANKTELKTIKVKSTLEIPKNFTGIAKYRNGTKFWYLNGKQHRTDGPAVECSNGHKEWWLNGVLHRVDGPAVEWADGHKEWRVNGLRHRVDGPAVEYSNGHKEWWVGGQEYSESDWKVTVENMKKETEQKTMEETTKEETVAANKTELKTINVNYWDDIPENFTGIAEYPNGSKHWFLIGERHRVDGPAVEWPNGDKDWYLNGKLHRVDGPAIEYPNGSKEWWLDGKLHRIDGPAIECADGHKEWFLNGKSYSKSNWKVAVEKLKKETFLASPYDCTHLDTTLSCPRYSQQFINLEFCSVNSAKSSIKETAKKDFNAVMVRVAADKLSTTIQSVLISIISKSLDNKTTKQIDTFFSSKQGKVFIKMMVGIIVPMLIQKFPERFQELLERVATESRIQAEVQVATEMVDFIKEFIVPMLGHFAESMESSSNGQKTTNIRVSLEGKSTGDFVEDNLFAENHVGNSLVHNIS